MTAGRPSPLGATCDAAGVSFALFSAHASAVELCLFDSPDAPSERLRIPLAGPTDGVWRTRVAGLRSGALYGYRVYGPWAPAAGHRFNPAKLLLDPYARAITGEVRVADAHFAYALDHPDRDLSFSPVDSAPVTPRCVVLDDAFEWGDDAPPRTPWSRSLIYECHVKGMTARHPGVPPELRGTYLGLACEPVIAHLQSLGVTAVELLPIQHAAIERHLVAAGLTNYWGYSTVGFFAPDARWATGALGQQVREFKQMVRSLHAAGLEVILDVAYNHTGEGSEAGATLAFRGLDNRSYYRLLPEDPRRHLDFTGCGNTLDLDQPRVLELVIESLRYWVREMHVDGFRFDLATALARHPIEFRRDAPFFQAIAADPLLSRVKLIAEPWDLGPGGYQLGAFPAGFAEWNGRYRDAVRSFWGGFDAPVGELASRLSGSSDVFQPGGRGPHASVNFVTCHDGFTIADLVSYERKHNEENREENRDGSDYNLSRNFGVEGPSDSPFVRRLRARVQRNFLATLYLSHGVPMLSHGDELGRSQSGNNNAYCLDCETTWIDWQLGPDSEALLAFARELARVRRATPALRREAFFAGVAATSGGKDLAWLRGDGAEMGQADWQDSRRRVLGMLVYPDRQAIPGVEDGSGLLLLVNAGEDAVYFVLPSLEEKGRWREVLHTARPPARTPRPRGVNLIGRSLILLRHEAEPAAPIRTP